MKDMSDTGDTFPRPFGKKKEEEKEEEEVKLKSKEGCCYI